MRPECSLPLALFLGLGASCTAPAAVSLNERVARLDPGPIDVPSGSGRIDEFLRPCTADGRPVVITPADMPWRVEVGLPKNTPQDGGRREAQLAAAEALLAWEGAIRTELPWFEMELSERDAEADVRIEWKRRMTGDAAGRAGPRCAEREGRIVAGGHIELSVQPCPTCGRNTIDEIRMLIAHEFGHVLGLGHCLDCESAMNYSWHTRDRVFVTAVDVDAVSRFVAWYAPDGEEPTADDGDEMPSNRGGRPR